MHPPENAHLETVWKVLYSLDLNICRSLRRSVKTYSKMSNDKFFSSSQFFVTLEDPGLVNEAIYRAYM